MKRNDSKRMKIDEKAASEMVHLYYSVFFRRRGRILCVFEIVSFFDFNEGII